VFLVRFILFLKLSCSISLPKSDKSLEKLIFLVEVCLKFAKILAKTNRQGSDLD
jgi:hypothetical protein